MRIVVAMSGGVDSSVAAALLTEHGHEVIGLSMQLYDQRDGQHGFGTCCTIDDLHDARRVASVLGIPHYVVNFERQFQDQVLSNFVSEYLSGRTPIPCVHCNSDLKFATLLDRAQAFGAEMVATGHYARVARVADGQLTLRRGVDRDKDQSYFLFSLTQQQLRHAMFPVGGLQKAAVREYARTRRLPVAEKPDSQEICFVPDRDYARFIEQHACVGKETGGARPPAEGLIVSQTGAVLGWHSGVHRFTVGQRKGLGLTTGTPLYVLKLRPAENQVVVGPREALEGTSLTASGVNWLVGHPPAEWVHVDAQIRHRHLAARARVRALPDNRAELEFDTPQLAITPGQAVVFYDGEAVVGGGWIN
jgi:tRNA-specific 2-thiouridylase